MVLGGKEKTKANKSKTVKEEKSTDEFFDPIKIDARQANTAVLMLESPEEEVLQKTLESIFKFCEKSENNKLIVHELGATDKIFALISHDERVIQRNATMVFGLLSCHSEVRKYLKSHYDYLEKMMSLINANYDQLTNEYAAMWLRNLSEDFKIKSAIASNQEAINNLINILGFSDPDAVYNALGTMDAIMVDFDARKLVRELKGIEPILNLIKSEFPQIQELAFSALIKINYNAENREVFRELGGMEKLVEFLANSNQKEMHVNCLNLVSVCLEDTQSLDLIQQNGGLNKILAYCQDLSDESDLSAQINSAAAKAIAKSARKLENRKILNEQQAEKMLIYQLLNDNDETKAAAAHALAIMAESNFCQDAIRNYEGIDVLVRLLSSENAKVREQSCFALANLTLNNQINCRCILNAQGIEPLVNLLKDEVDRTKGFACVCLINMANDQVIREEVGLYSFVQSIIPALASKNTFTQSKACFTIASYSVDSLIRTELKASTALQQIVDLIKSNDSEVRKNACWAITSSASDFNIAVEFCKYGAIETLKEINLSSQRKSAFTEAALNKLLEVNLSAKYALTNHLDATDYLFDGFYDMGPMRPNGRFYSLDELSKIPVNDKRPIIIVYAPEENVQNTIDSKSETLIKTKSAKGSASKLGREKDSKTSKPKRSSSELKKSNEEMNKSSATIHHQSFHAEESSKPNLLGMETFKPIQDKDLKLWVEQVRDLFHKMPVREQVTQLAQFVSEKLGGVVKRDEVNNLGYELLINETKYELKTNIIPVGKLRLGTFYHRALLFKILADRLQLKVTLDRGDYNRAWNKIALKESYESPYPPEHYIVDLMHEPGKLMKVDSLDAIQYIRF